MMKIAKTNMFFPLWKNPYGSYSRAEEKLRSPGTIKTSGSMLVAGAKKSMSV